MSDGSESSWVIGKQERPEEGTGRTKKDIQDWLLLTSRLRETAIAAKLSKNEVARRSGVSIGTLSEWYSGKYKGRLDTINLRIEQWLDVFQEQATLAATAARAPNFVMTETAQEIEQTLSYAQMLPEMTVITLAAGLGKTATARHYIATRPNAYLVTMSPTTKSVYGMLLEIAGALQLSTRSTSKLHRIIGERLSRNPNSLLIIDEAQNLVDAAVDQARTFLDQYDCGLALLGNDEIYTRFDSQQNGPSYAQIRRRIGVKIRRMKPLASDIKALIDAWSIEEPESRKLLTGIGNKPGALGQIDKTMRLASLLAAGQSEKVQEKHIRAAWKNRGMETL